MAQKAVDCSTLPNKQRRSYSIKAITNACIALLEERPLEDITIGQLVAQAQVSRNSFYRNFDDKQSILQGHLVYILRQWSGTTMPRGQELKVAHYRELFELVEAQQDFFTLLARRKQLHLLLLALEEVMPPHEGLTSIESYTHAFFLHGLYGWVHHWVGRSFTESTDDLVALLVAAGHN